MNLDELANSVSESELRERLLHWIGEWKQDDQDIEELAYLIGKWHGNVWLKETDASNKFHSDFQAFKSAAIDNIGGLTLNERLYWFGLLKHGKMAMNLHNNACVANSMQMPNKARQSDGFRYTFGYCRNSKLCSD
ncbi:hypothetical protein [Shewanella woodyi]|uniref:hypothetical protein n=1 Tax=Shewanella woodyi TaxID=60961 RepID=UPI003749964E